MNDSTIPNLNVLLATYRPPDSVGKGDAKSAYRVSQALRAAGCNVFLLTVRRANVAKRVVNTLSALVNGRPLQIGLSEQNGFSRLLQNIYKRNQIDLIVAVHARAAAQVPLSLRKRAFAFIIDAYGQSYMTYVPYLPSWQKAAYLTEAKRMCRLELELVRDFGGAGVVSNRDREFLIENHADPDKVHVISGGVEMDYFNGSERKVDRSRPKFVFIGRLNYFPNEDAVRYLVFNVWPPIRDAIPRSRLRIVGARPSEALRGIVDRAGVEIAADVPDVRREMSDATALLVPMRCGGGIQNKILEAMAARLPVICSSFANAGIGADDRLHLLVADAPIEFARCAIWITNEQDQAESLADRAYKWVASTQSQEVFAEHLVAAIQSLVSVH